MLPEYENLYEVSKNIITRTVEQFKIIIAYSIFPE